MTCSRTIEVSPGIIWETLSSGGLPHGPVVCVPVKDLAELTDAKIGELVRYATWTAKLAAACMLAYNIVHEAKFARKPSDLLKKFEWRDLEYLYRFIGDDPEIDKAIDLLTPAIAEQGNADEANRIKKAKRAEVAADYHRLFVTIGRRDGFSCASCGNTANDLQIDHVMPVSKGGSNDLDNLQLLCRTCNIVKGAKI